MKTHEDLTIKEYKSIKKLTKGTRITMYRLRELIPIIAKQYDLSDKEAFAAIKYTSIYNWN